MKNSSSGLHRTVPTHIHRGFKIYIVLGMSMEITDFRRHFLKKM